MPDITMCTNGKCPLSGKCFRFRAMPSEFMQAYSCFQPSGYEMDADCDWFMEIGDRKVRP